MNNFTTAVLRTAGFLGAAILLSLLLPTPMRAQAPVIIDFDGIQSTLIFNQFASQGITFNGPLARDFSPTPGFAHSGTKAIELCFAQEFCSAPLNINFTVGQAHAKVWVGYTAQLTQPTRVTMQALAGNGQLVGQTSVVLGPSAGPVPVQNPLEVNSPSANIRQVIVGLAAPAGETAFNNGLVIDDVEFGTAGPAPTCGAAVPPTVSLDQPANTLQTPEVIVQTNEFLLEGDVQTLAPLDVARLTVTKTPGFPAITNTADLLSTIVQRDGGNFGAIRMNGILFPGRNRISVRMENCAGAGADTAVVVFNPIAAGTGFKFLGLEVNQATQDLTNSVPLVGEKPTLVRVYVSVTGPTTSIDSLSGALTAKRPGGPTLTPLLRSINIIKANSSTDVQAKRRDLTASLNFMLPADWFRTGTLHLELSKLFINEAELNLPCAGCGNVDEIGAPRFVVFRRTKTLNLVLAPYEYSLSQTPTPDILFTPMGALQWLNNVYPLAGSFPSSGSGIRLLRILPARPTTRDLHASGGIGDFLDDLQDVMNDLQDQNGSNWPSDARLFGMVPSGSGGAGRMPGNVAYGDTWAVENGLVPQPNYESYGSIWAQEIAHNLGRKHVSTSHGEQPPSDSSFPFPHGGIGQPGAAIITGYWITSPPSLISTGTAADCIAHAHDFMSYGSVNSASGEHTRSWVSPFTYKALFKAFEDLSQVSAAAPPERAEKLIVAGRITENGTVTLRPFRRVTTEFTTGPGTKGEYSVELVDAAGRTLLSHRFDEREDEGGKFHLRSFNEYVLWRDGTQEILIKRGKTVVAKRAVSPHKPWVRVLTPKQGQTWGRKATITWEAGDEDKDSLTYTVLYNSGLDSVWLPIASGLTRPSATVDTSLLPGSARARVRVRATDGVNTAEAESQGTFIVADKRPLVAILGPINGQVLAPGVSPQFAAAVYDPEDGMLSGTSLKWTSDRDGLVGYGLGPSMRALSSGEHFITLTASDSQGN
ncbi:MAG: hypothetical protein ABI967_12380, partial [bacterium]